jgi:hypothetical protein
MTAREQRVAEMVAEAPASAGGSLSACLPAAELAAQINAEHSHARACARKALEHARRAGDLLLQAKAAMGHGAWLPWIARNCEFTARTAQRYIELAENWTVIASKCDRYSHLTLTAALRLIDRRCATELEQAKALERCRNDLRIELQLLGAAADVILTDPNADVDTVETITRRARAFEFEAVRLRERAAREYERLSACDARMPELHQQELSTAQSATDKGSRLCVRPFGTASAAPSKAQT